MTYSPRRSPEQWQALIDQWQTSGQSAALFCDEQAIGYASFCRWRNRLADIQSSAIDHASSFFDLSALATDGADRHTWNIVLSLGNGVELRLSQV